MSTMASQITSLTIVYSTVYSRIRSKKTSKFRVTGLCAGNSPVTGEFPTQRASIAENVSIWWRHDERPSRNLTQRLSLEMRALTLRTTPRPNVTSPATVRWSNSSRSGMLAKRRRNSFTCGHVTWQLVLVLCVSNDVVGCFPLTLYVLNFSEGTQNIYLHFMSFLHIDMTQVVEILRQIRQGPTYSTKSISWLLVSWRRQEPGHQQLWYWHS